MQVTADPLTVALPEESSLKLFPESSSVVYTEQAIFEVGSPVEAIVMAKETTIVPV
jgi:hypothetical protein